MGLSIIKSSPTAAWFPVSHESTWEHLAGLVAKGQCYLSVPGIYDHWINGRSGLIFEFYLIKICLLIVAKGLTLVESQVVNRLIFSTYLLSGWPRILRNMSHIKVQKPWRS